MKIVSNTFGLTAVINGKSFLVDLEILSGSLHQFYDKNSKTFSPDWTTQSAQPSFKMVVRDTEGTAYEVKDTKFYYQGTLIEFGSNGLSTTAVPVVGAFKKESIDKKGDIPAYTKYTIVKNLASDSNTDNDYISIEGIVQTEGNNTQTVKTGSIPITIIQTASGGVSYFLSITAPAITEEGGKVTLVARLYSSDTSGEVDISSRTDGKWVKFDGSKWGTTSLGSKSTLEVSDDDIDGCEMYKYTIPVSVGSTETISAVTSVLDQTDNLFCEIECTGTTVPWRLQTGETAKISAKIVDKNGKNVTGTGLSPKFILTKADGSAPDTQPSGSEVSITYSDLVEKYGGSLTGYVSFEK
ncbi:MAG: hypothetical protein ACI3YT_07070 [Prevotella sp.]